MDDDETYAFRFALAYLLPALVFGVTPPRSRVTVIGGTVEVRFGPWRLTTDVDNVAGTEITGPFQFLKTAGPAHLSRVDRGITFATNADAGVCIRFREPVAVTYPGPLPPRRHTAVTVTVADPAALAANLSGAGRR